MGLWQEVTVDVTGPVDVRNPFVVTDLPLPKTDPGLAHRLGRFGQRQPDRPRTACSAA